jgi:membrane peptidoglycan carboxypeptidase
MTFRTAIAKSNNVAATRILTKVGIQNVVQKAHMLGIQSPLSPYPALALGASEITLLESTSAYGVFATRGLRAEPTPVDRVENYAGEVLMEHTHPVHGARVLSEEAGSRMWEMLRYVVTSGTGTNAQIDGVDVIGKTGTTSENKDVWFMGATNKLAVGVWMGFDKPKELPGSSGGRWCAPAWRSFTLRALDIVAQRNPVEKMIEDERATQLQRLRARQFKKLVRVTICSESGLQATSACKNTVVQAFSAAGGATGNAPTQFCDIHGQNPRVRTLDQAGGSDAAQPGDLNYREETSPARRESTSYETTGSGEATGANTYPGESASVYPAAATTRENMTRRDAPRDESAPARSAGSEEAAYAVEGEAPDAAQNGEVVATVCAESGQLASSRCPVTLQQFFLASDVPRRRCSQHR